MDNVNWNQLEQDAIGAVSTAKYDGASKDAFFKCKPGIHKLRLMPTGNKLDNLPYIKVTQHVMRLPTAEGRIAPIFMLCNTFLWNNLLSKPTDDEKRHNSLIGYLMKAGKMNPEEFKKVQDYGCPVCKGYQHMNIHGVETETKNALLPKEQYMWNVIWRRGQFSGDDKVYVWGISKMHFNSVIAQIRQDKAQGYFTLDPDKGFDLTWSASGEGLARRYGAPMFDRVPTPINLQQDQIAFDLAEIAIASYKPYQEVLNNLKQGFGKRLSELAFIPEGDTAVHQHYSTPESMSVPLASQTPQQMAIAQMPISMQQQVAPPPVDLGKEIFEGGYYKMGGKLYSPDGKELF